MQAWLIAVSMVISSWDVQTPLLLRCSCFIRSHLQEYSYHAVSLSLFCTLLLIFSLSSFIIPPFKKNMASLSLAPSHPSYSQSARLYLFFLTSHSFFPIFQPLLFPPSLLSLPFPDIIHFSTPSFPSHSVHPFVSALCPPHTRIHLPFPLPTSLFRVCNLSHFLTSSIAHWPRVHPDIIG